MLIATIKPLVWILPILFYMFAILLALITAHFLLYANDYGNGISAGVVTIAFLFFARIAQRVKRKVIG